MRTEVELLLVGLGGALGAISRYGVSEFAKKAFSGPFPIGTLIANLAGCFLIGMFIGSGYGEKSDALRLSFGVGFLGAFTTFSTFSAETLNHLNSVHWPFAVSNVLANVILGIACVFLGIIASKRFLG